MFSGITEYPGVRRPITRLDSDTLAELSSRTDSHLSGLLSYDKFTAAVLEGLDAVQAGKLACGILEAGGRDALIQMARREKKYTVLPDSSTGVPSYIRAVWLQNGDPSAIFGDLVGRGASNRAHWKVNLITGVVNTILLAHTHIETSDCRDDPLEFYRKDFNGLVDEGKRSLASMLSIQNKQAFAHYSEVTRDGTIPNVIHLQQVPDPEYGEYGLVALETTFCNGDAAGPYRFLLRDLPISEVVRLSHQLAKAVGTMNSRGYLHHDLKPANILVNEVNGLDLYIGDVGVMSRIGDLAGMCLGSYATMAPERRRNPLTASPLHAEAVEFAQALHMIFVSVSSSPRAGTPRHPMTPPVSITMPPSPLGEDPIRSAYTNLISRILSPNPLQCHTVAELEIELHKLLQLIAP